MNQKKVGTRKSGIIANQKQPINRRMKTSNEFNLPDQLHRGEDPVKIRRMEKLNTKKIKYGKNHKDKMEIPLYDTCSQEDYQEVLSGSEKFRDLVDKLDGMKTLEEDTYDPLFEIKCIKNIP